jgi:phosphoglycolate phosphatase-like HAD superfamily hydrolase
LPGSIAWIDRLRSERKRIAVLASGERVAAALELAGIADRFDVVVTGSHVEQLVAGALHQLNVEPDRAVVVGVEPSDLEAARAAARYWRSASREGTAHPSSSAAPAPTRSPPTFRSCWAQPEPTTPVHRAPTPPARHET